MKFKTFAALAALILSISTTYAGLTGQRSVVSYGCHNDNSNICYVEVTGAAVNGGSCTSNSIRWNTSTQGGKAWLVLIGSAASSGGTIDLNITGCHPTQSAYPTFNYGHVYP